MGEDKKLNDGSAEFNAMQRVKRRFFAMRNGAVAQQMASYGGKKYQINFGLNLPQISEIARDFLPGGSEFCDSENRADFARKLRDNRSTRESMLIAPMLFPVEELGIAEALDWAAEAPTPEVVDILCMKLLRNHPAAASVVRSLLVEARTDLGVYAGLRLLLNLLQIGKIEGKDAEAIMENWSRGDDIDPTPLTQGVLRQLREELEFLSEEQG